MAGTKYIIGSNVKFVRGRGEFVNVAPSATHYKCNDADKFLTNRKDLCKYRVRNSSGSKKDYVLGQLMYAVGNDNNVVINLEAAKQFSSFDEAVEFIKNNKELIAKLEVPYVYDDHFNKYKDVSDILKEDPKVLEPPLPSVNNGKEGVVPTPRIYMTPTQRARVYSKSNKICCICGKPMKYEEFTVEHVIPLSRGGTYDDDNLQGAHLKCNSMKNNMDPAEFNNLVGDIAAHQMIKNFDYNRMLTMSRAMVRGTIASFGGLQC